MDFIEKDAKDNILWGGIREFTLAERIIRRLKRDHVHNLADIGCGDGYLIYSILKKRDYIDKIYAIDISSTRLKRVKAISRRINTIKTNATNICFPDNFFDVVICSEVLEHIADYEKAVRELLRVTKKQLVITVPNDQVLVKTMCPRCKKYNYISGHINSFDKGTLREAILNNNPGKKIKIEFEKFHTIYSYNRLTKKLPSLLRVLLDKALLSLESRISFFKPNYLMAVIKVA